MIIVKKRDHSVAQVLSPSELMDEGQATPKKEVKNKNCRVWFYALNKAVAELIKNGVVTSPVQLSEMLGLPHSTAMVFYRRAVGNRDVPAAVRIGNNLVIDNAWTITVSLGDQDAVISIEDFTDAVVDALCEAVANAKGSIMSLRASVLLKSALEKLGIRTKTLKYGVITAGLINTLIALTFDYIVEMRHTPALVLRYDVNAVRGLCTE